MYQMLGHIKKCNKHPTKSAPKIIGKSDKKKHIFHATPF